MNIETLKRYTPHIVAGALGLLAVLGVYNYIAPQDEMLGAGYNPVTGYQSRTTSYITGSASTIPVASTKDPAGNQIVLSNISSSSTVKVFFTLEPGTSRQESVMCTGVTSASWTSCTRGLPFQGSSEAASTTLQFAHNAGSPIVMTNISQFYNEYVAVEGYQEVGGMKNFTTYPRFYATTTVPTLSAEFATKYYVDTVGAGGFTANNVSSTMGLVALSGTPSCPSAGACVGVNISATSSGLYFDTTFEGKLKLYTSSTGGIAVDSDGKVYVDTTDNFVWTGSHLFQGAVTTTNSLRVMLPTSTLDAANKSYVDSSVAYGTATGTAGMAITAGRALYMGSTSTLFHTDATLGSTTATTRFVGFALTSATVGSEVVFSPPSHVNCGLSGLSAGYNYYLNGASGQIDLTPGVTTSSVRIGRSLSANCLMVSNPSFVVSGSFTTSSGGGTITGANYFNTGFYPARVEVRAAADGSGSCDNIISIGDDTNVSVQNNGLANSAAYNLTRAISVNAAGPVLCAAGTITKSATGFTINFSALATDTIGVEWVAYSN